MSEFRIIWEGMEPEPKNPVQDFINRYGDHPRTHVIAIRRKPNWQGYSVALIPQEFPWDCPFGDYRAYDEADKADHKEDCTRHDKPVTFRLSL